MLRTYLQLFCCYELLIYQHHEAAVDIPHILPLLNIIVEGSAWVLQEMRAKISLSFHHF